MMYLLVLLGTRMSSLLFFRKVDKVEAFLYTCIWLIQLSW